MTSNKRINVIYMQHGSSSEPLTVHAVIEQLREKVTFYYSCALSLFHKANLFCGSEK